MKLGRNYRLTIETDEGETIVIGNPTTMQFTVKRSTMASLNSAQINIYNLAPKTRDKIFQDRFNPKKYTKVILQAGYESLSTVFIGNLFEANSKREGSDVITYIDARDGGFDTVGTITNKAIEGGNVKDVIKSLARDFEKVNVGEIGDVEGEFRRQVILNGNTFSLIKKYSEGNAFIDFETLNVLKDDEAIVGDLPLLTSESGLISVSRDDSYLTVKTLFEPKIIMGQLLEISSDVAPVFDGQYKVIGLTHQGVISGSVGGELNSTFNLLVGSQLFGGFKTV